MFLHQLDYNKIKKDTVLHKQFKLDYDGYPVTLSIHGTKSFFGLFNDKAFITVDIDKELVQKFYGYIPGSNNNLTYLSFNLHFHDDHKFLQDLYQSYNKFPYKIQEEKKAELNSFLEIVKEIKETIEGKYGHHIDGCMFEKYFPHFIDEPIKIPIFNEDINIEYFIDSPQKFFSYKEVNDQAPATTLEYIAEPINQNGILEIQPSNTNILESEYLYN